MPQLIRKKHLITFIKMHINIIHIYIIINQSNRVQIYNPTQPKMLNPVKLSLILTFLWICTCRFDPQLAKNLFYLNTVTYCRPKAVQDWSCKPCGQSVIKLTQVKPFYNSTGDVLGILGIAKNPTAMILIFRGTDPRGWKNWVEDFNFIKVKFPLCNNGCQVHRGFWHAFQEVEQAVLKTVKQYRDKYQIQSLIIVGHSLGGALASHAAISLKNQGVDIQLVYTYGSPRVGDSKFSEWYDQYLSKTQKIRITHGHDPVPHLPPHSFGFNHVPHEIFQVGNIDKGYVICSDTASREDPACSDKFKLDTNVLDHGDYCGINFLAIFDTCQL